MSILTDSTADSETPTLVLETSSPKQTAKLTGLGCLIADDRIAFRVWAPNATSVSLIGDFNDWDEDATVMEEEDGGCWYAEPGNAKIGDGYKYCIKNGDQTLYRVDPRVREVTNSVGNGIVHDPNFDWGDQEFKISHWNELVVYEMHIGTFSKPDENSVGTFDTVIANLDHLKSLGINAIEVMPVAEFAGDYSWGYNPAHIFAIESAYGGPKGFKTFVKRCHEAGIAVILDVVYNHFGPSDLQLWQFDGWSENDKGGIYFYNDWRSQTPWGDTRPDFGRSEVRQFIFDNALMWIEEYHVDGLRYDMTLYIRSIHGSEDSNLPEGWSLTQWINQEIHNRHPGKLTIAEDLQNNPMMTKPTEWDGAGFSSQWDAAFVHPIRDVLIQPEDSSRSMQKVQSAIEARYNSDAFERVVYTESHDEVANGKARVPAEVSPDSQHDRFAQKRATLGLGLVLTTPGIPMLFQGQELLQGGWFQDTEELAWENKDEHLGIFQLCRQLVRMRRNMNGQTAGLTGQHVDVYHVNDTDKVVVFERRKEGGPGDTTIVVANFSNQTLTDYHIGMPAAGEWIVRLNSDWRKFSDEFDDTLNGQVIADETSYDGKPCSTAVSLGPYAFLVLSQAKA